MSKQAISKAIAIAGSQARLAALVGSTQQSVSWWLNSGVVPPKWVLPIERATDNHVTRHELRPDLYPKDAA
jgi:DNA-binding transcriptional regulator YdaS (Cro superfamily)